MTIIEIRNKYALVLCHHHFYLLFNVDNLDVLIIPNHLNLHETHYIFCCTPYYNLNPKIESLEEIYFNLQKKNSPIDLKCIDIR